MDLTGLYAIVDPEHCDGQAPLTLAEHVLAGGCCALQLRAKQLADEDYTQLGKTLREACRGAGVPFFVNDRVHLVTRIGADGVHLGQGDMPAAQARHLLPDHLIGLSTHDERQAREACASGQVDLIGFGPIFPTHTKENPDAVVGLQALCRVCAAVSLPVVAIGGIDVGQAAEVFRCGAQMVAMISALSRSANPRQTAAHVHGMYGAGG